jgi:hypothetical protein
VDIHAVSLGEWIYFWAVLLLTGGIAGTVVVAGRRYRNRFTGLPTRAKRRRARGPLRYRGP